jgi:hypothetical protein
MKTPAVPSPPKLGAIQLLLVCWLAKSLPCWGFQPERLSTMPSKGWPLCQKRPFSRSPCLSATSSSAASSRILAEQPTLSRRWANDGDAANKEAEVEKQQQQQLPYAVARGDGSTGGGGLPMPDQMRKQKQQFREEEDTEEEEDSPRLRRPKVGAEMPKGRPSWFHVPAPSQGTSWFDPVGAIGGRLASALCRYVAHRLSRLQCASRQRW